MKKTLLILCCVALLAGMSSCNKKCKCTTKSTMNGQVISETTSEGELTKEDKEKLGIKKCSDMNDSWTESEGGITITAEVKCKSAM